jgi:hypothetical protein
VKGKAFFPLTGVRPQQYVLEAKLSVHGSTAKYKNNDHLSAVSNQPEVAFSLG